ncbi:helix-turn-helix transcriptional regulator [Sulfitobacter sabulilitoris]|uniref:Helix-turn-helix transcriptional regulator n=1 Tax=Sulfitobacter sabulilitoris TaxID=2562655 RepID=A0A5S3QC13_9RHOB|nr:helix-turn-helix transcriptional regulator [Sulfitobacter sabulilitoris]TMM54632.1 helix-turn-helix transcriptional regulator [Sulfitobacter sabulilitoris]
MPRSADTASSDPVRFPTAAPLEVRIERSFALITKWAAAMSGHGDFNKIVSGLIAQVQGANLVVYRLALADFTPRIIAAACDRRGQTRPDRPGVALARFLLDRHRESALPGTIWRLSELREDPRFAASAANREWAHRTEICEVSLIVMEQQDGHIDLIEIAFETPPNRHKQLSTSVITRSLADGWAARAPGIVSRMIAAQGRMRGSTAGHDTDHASPSILGGFNPYNLSRSEQRVCHLLAGGLKPREMAQELNVSIATIRTHLRNVYAKTGASGQVEVMARLHADTQTEQDQPTLSRAG